jgi:hypothetical protein
VLVAHTCNPSYSGGRDQKDGGSKPAWVNSVWDPISKQQQQQQKKPITENGAVAQGVAPEFKPWYYCMNNGEKEVKRSQDPHRPTFW